MSAERRRSVCYIHLIHRFHRARRDLVAWAAVA
jgi:hypothetical protein